jgi:hypothetical protein
VDANPDYRRDRQQQQRQGSKLEPANRGNRFFRCILVCFPFELTSRAAGQGPHPQRAARALRWRAPPPLPSPHRLCCLCSRSLPSQSRILRIKILISNLDMTLHVPEGKAASVGGSASIGPIPKHRGANGCKLG